MIIHSGIHDYTLIIEKSFDFVPALIDTEKTYYVVDENVFRLYPALFAGIPEERLTLFTAVEENKTIDAALAICERMTGLSARRNARLVSFGGGITQDVTGFAANVFALNFLPGAYADCIEWLFLTNAKRYTQMAAPLAKLEARLQIVATFNVTRTQGAFPYVLNYSALIDPGTEIPDNSLVMLLRALIGANVGSVALAGFDGYRASEMNYYKTNMEYGFAKDKADYLNGYVRAFLEETASRLPVTFVTASMYEKAGED